MGMGVRKSKKMTVRRRIRPARSCRCRSSRRPFAPKRSSKPLKRCEGHVPLGIILHALQYIRAMQKEIQKINMEMEAAITTSQLPPTHSDVPDDNPRRIHPPRVEVRREEGGVRILVWCEKRAGLVQQITQQLELLYLNFIRLSFTSDRQFHVDALVSNKNAQEVLEPNKVKELLMQIVKGGGKGKSDT